VEKKSRINSTPAPVPLADYRGVLVAVTGGTGFIGAHLARALTAAGARVHLLNRPDFDLARPDEAAKAVENSGAAVVFHLAAAGVSDLFGARAELSVNGRGTAALLEGSRRGGAERVVCFGTCFEYAPSQSPLTEDAPLAPCNPYAETKAAAFAAARAAVSEHGQDIVWLRPFAVYGPGQPSPKLIPSLIAATLARRPLALGSGVPAWDYVHVDDLVSAALLLGTRPGAARGVFNCGTGAAFSARRIAAMIEGQTGRKAQLDWGARPDRPGDPAFMAADASRLRALGWRPHHDLAGGLAALLAAESVA
jgi:UDP-glucose 4-epimerase